MREPLRLLIVEDVPEQAEIIAHELSNAGFALEWSVATDRDGCRLALEAGVDVVVGDCNTIDIDLPALMALVGEQPNPPAVISVSTDDREVLARDCLHMGASAFLHKFRLDEIGDLVRRLITERRLRRAAEMSDAGTASHGLTAAALDLIVEISADGRILYVNPSVETAVGYPVAQLTGRRVFEFLHADELPGVLELLQEAIGTGSARQMIHRVRQRDGSWRWFESTGKPYRSEQGEQRVVGISREISPGLLEEGELQATARERTRETSSPRSERREQLGHLVDRIAHDLDSQLVVIASEAEGIKGRLGPANPLLRNLDQILAAVERAAQRVHQLAGSSQEVRSDSPLRFESR